MPRWLPFGFAVSTSLILMNPFAVRPLARDADGGQSPTLTRPTAQTVISSSPRFATAATIALVDPGQTVKAGVREGFWHEQGFGGIALTADGRQAFGQIAGFPEYIATLPNPIRREVVSITGIADATVGRNLKEVQFRWRYVGLSEAAARYTGQGVSPHDGVAVVRLYDDGWRVEDIQLNETGRVPFRYDPVLLARAQRAEAETERTRQEAARQRDRALETMRQAQQDRAERERIAKISTKKIASYTLENVGRESVTTTSLEVSDADAKITTARRYPTLPPALQQERPTVWTIEYWLVDKFETRTDSLGHKSVVVQPRIGTFMLPDSPAARAKFDEALRQLENARLAWKNKYTDRVNWIPVDDNSAAQPAMALSPEQVAVKPTVPSGAVARCQNGYYVYVSTGADTCKGAGGVAEWLKKQ
jgi:hypothetical protein